MLDNVIPLRLVQGVARPLAIRGLSKDEKEALEQFLQVLRKGTQEKRAALKLNVSAHYNTLPGGIWAE